MGLVSGFELLIDLRHRGFRLQPGDGRVRIAPSCRLTPEVRETLVARKGEVLAALSVEARILQMPLYRFEREGRLLQVSVPWLSETLWFVPGEQQVERLTRRGIKRGRIWTARELNLLWSVPSVDQKAVEKLGVIKAQLEGELLSVEGPSEGAPHA